MRPARRQRRPRSLRPATAGSSGRNAMVIVCFLLGAGRWPGCTAPRHQLFQSSQPGGGMAKTSDVTRARKATAPVLIEIRLDEPEPETLRAIGGSRSDQFNNALIDAMVTTGWFPPGQSDEDSQPPIARRGHRPAGVRAGRRDRGHDCCTSDGGAPRIDGAQPARDACGSAVTASRGRPVRNRQPRSALLSAPTVIGTLACSAVASRYIAAASPYFSSSSSSRMSSSALPEWMRPKSSATSIVASSCRTVLTVGWTSVTNTGLRAGAEPSVGATGVAASRSSSGLSLHPATP